MSEKKFKKVMEILEKVIQINATKGTKLIADLGNNRLHICDADNGCSTIMNYKGITGTIYFDWDNEFDGLVSEMNKALDQYLV